MMGAEAAMSSVYDLPGSPIEKIRALTMEILDESGTPYFMLIHHARTSDGVPEKVKELIDRNDMNAFIERLLPLFREGQQAGEIVDGNPEELISSYLSVLSGLMVVNAQGIDGYRLPEIDMLLRLITRQ
jgi:hypothetical protein